MKLSAEQCETLDREGYLFLPELFSAAEAAVLRAALPAVFARKGPEIVRERNGAVRTAFGVHTYSDIYWRLSRHPRLAEPAMQVLGGPDLHPPVQGERQGRVRRRRLAVASGLRHMVAGRPDAGTPEP